MLRAVLGLGDPRLIHAEDFILGIAIDGRDEAVYRVDIHDETGTQRAIAADFRTYLRDRLGT